MRMNPIAMTIIHPPKEIQGGKGRNNAFPTKSSNAIKETFKVHLSNTNVLSLDVYKFVLQIMKYLFASLPHNPKPEEQAFSKHCGKRRKCW